MIGLIFSVILVSCTVSNNGFISKHKKKTIKLSNISQQIKVGYETKNAIIYVGKQDAMRLTEKLLSNKNLDHRFDEIIFNDLTKNLDTLNRIQNNTTVKHWQAKQSNFNLHDYNFVGFIDQWILKDLIIKGKAEVFNKTTNRKY